MPKRQQHRSAFLIAPRPDPWGCYPARPGDRIPIAALRRVSVEDFLGHVADPPVSAGTAPIVAQLRARRPARPGADRLSRYAPPARPPTPGRALPALDRNCVRQPN